VSPRQDYLNSQFPRGGTTWYAIASGKGEHMETSSVGNSSACRLFVGNISSQVTEGRLRAIVGQFGTVKDIQLASAKMRGKGHGAFIEMFDEQAAAHVIATLNGIEMDGRCLKVRLDS
jgi:RNA recognition motif-containing protein